jgi:hypothetical protein
MRDLKADWRRWTRVERIVAVFVALGMSSMVPALLLLGEGVVSGRRSTAIDHGASSWRMLTWVSLSDRF